MDEPMRSDALISTIRHTVACHVQSVSLRSVAREIGMSVSGLMKFLNGARPYRATYSRLRRWYVAHRASPNRGDLDRDDVVAAVFVLTRGLTAGEREKTAQSLLDSLRLGYRDRAPEWLRDLQAADVLE